MFSSFQRFPVTVEYNFGIIGVKNVPAFMLDGTPVPAVVNDVLQAGKSVHDIRGRD